MILTKYVELTSKLRSPTDQASPRGHNKKNTEGHHPQSRRHQIDVSPNLAIWTLTAAVPRDPACQSRGASSIPFYASMLQLNTEQILAQQKYEYVESIVK